MAAIEVPQQYQPLARAHMTRHRPARCRLPIQDKIPRASGSRVVKVHCTPTHSFLSCSFSWGHEGMVVYPSQRNQLSVSSFYVASLFILQVAIMNEAVKAHYVSTTPHHVSLPSRVSWRCAGNMILGKGARGRRTCSWMDHQSAPGSTASHTVQ